MTELLTNDLPETIADEEALEDFMARPTQGLVDDFARLDGDITVLGVAGKVGMVLARMAKRAAPDKRVTGIARFSNPGMREKLESWGVETIACDLLNRDAVEDLPKTKNVVFMAGRKFGTTGDEPFSWAMNAMVPGLVAEAFRESRIVAFSTLCVYPFTPVAENGATEDVPPAPPGEYANSCVGRERIFQYFSGRYGTPGRLMRLAYAIDLRYGVLQDVAGWVAEDRPIDLTASHAPVIWQGDAVNHILRALLHCTTPASPLNITGPETVSIRTIAEEFGRRLGRPPIFVGEEAKCSWVVSDAQQSRLFGYPVVPVSRMIDWTVDWRQRGQLLYGKPTRYESRDGRF